MTEYHHAPHTLDPTKELPESDEVAPSAGHDEEMADRVRELHDEHKAGVQEAAEGQRSPEEEPPYAPGEFQGPGSAEQEDDVSTFESQEPQQEPQQESDQEAQPEQVPEGTVQEVLDWVGDDQARAQQALDAERQGPNRSSLTAELEKRV
jgi:hypothetical protein